MANSTGNNGIKSLNKASEVLGCFGPDKLELGAVDISSKLKVPLTTVVRILATLTNMRFLERSEKTRKYSIGPMLYYLGSLYLDTTDIFKAAEPVIKTVNSLTSEAVSLGILQEGNVILIMKEESKHAFRLTHHIGTILPAYASAMGKILLSELSEAKVDVLFPDERLRPITEKTVATKSELKREFKEIRRNGTAFNREGGYDGVEGIASAVRDASGTAIAAMSLPVPIFRLDEKRRELFAGLIKRATNLISYRLGYKGDNNPYHNSEDIRSWWEQANSTNK